MEAREMERSEIAAYMKWICIVAIGVGVGSAVGLAWGVAAFGGALLLVIITAE
jgi:hypothetical protein